MGINVDLTDEDGQTLDSCLDPHMLMPRLLREFDLSASACLRFIDPYGDTVFNGYQIPVLLNELRALRSKLDAQTRGHIDSVIALAEKAQSAPHLYLKFEGD